MKDSILKDSLMSGASTILSMSSLLILLPIFINSVGLSNYGIFSILLLLININMYVGFGIDAALIKYLSSENNKSLRDTDIIVSASIVILSGIAFLILLIYFREYVIVEVFSLNNNLNVDFLYISMTVSGVIFLIGGVFKAILASKGKVYIFEFIKSIYTIIFWLSLVVSCTFGGGFNAFGIISLVTSIIWGICTMIIAIYIYGGIGLSGFLLNWRSSLIKQIHFSSNILLSNIFVLSFEPLTKILVINYFGTSSAAIYDISLRLKNQVQQLITKLLFPLYSSISKFDSTEKQLKFVIHSEVTILHLVAICIPLFLLLRPLLYWWMPDVSDSIYFTLTPILMSYILFSAVLTPGYYCLLSNHKLKTIIIYHMIILLVNFLVIFSTKDVLYYYSIVLGNAMALIAGFPIILSKQNIIPLDTLLQNRIDIKSHLILIIANCLFLIILNYFYHLELWWFLIIALVVSIQLYRAMKKILCDLEIITATSK
ncbi:MAG: hypothetical protein ABW168_27375 [Sedimenticola sp.]